MALMPRVLRSRLRFTTPRATLLRSLLFNSLAVSTPTESFRLERRSIASTCANAKTYAALLFHAYNASLIPHRCATKAPQRSH